MNVEKIFRDEDGSRSFTTIANGQSFCGIEPCGVVCHQSQKRRSTGKPRPSLSDKNDFRFSWSMETGEGNQSIQSWDASPGWKPCQKLSFLVSFWLCCSFKKKPLTISLCGCIWLGAQLPRWMNIEESTSPDKLLCHWPYIITMTSRSSLDCGERRSNLWLCWIPRRQMLSTYH